MAEILHAMPIPQNPKNIPVIPTAGRDLQRLPVFFIDKVY